MTDHQKYQEYKDATRWWRGALDDYHRDPDNADAAGWAAETHFNMTQAEAALPGGLEGYAQWESRPSYGPHQPFDPDDEPF